MPTLKIDASACSSTAGTVTIPIDGASASTLLTCSAEQLAAG